MLVLQFQTIYCSAVCSYYEGLCPWRHVGAKLHSACWCSMELELSAVSQDSSEHLVLKHKGCIL